MSRTPTLLGVAEATFLRAAAGLEGAPVLTTVTRISLTALVLIMPAGLMGMTYPLVLRAASRTADGIRRTASLLYAVNTTGAIVGVLFGSLWMVPTLGLSRTFLVAAGLNLVVAAVAWVASRDEMPLSHSNSDTVPSDAVSPVTTPFSGAARVTVLLVIALSGMVSLALESVNRAVSRRRPDAS